MQQCVGCLESDCEWCTYDPRPRSERRSHRRSEHFYVNSVYFDLGGDMTDKNFERLDLLAERIVLARWLSLLASLLALTVRPHSTALPLDTDGEPGPIEPLERLTPRQPHAPVVPAVPGSRERAAA